MTEADPIPQQEIAKDGPTSIVVGYDASDPARGAMAMALGLARRNQAFLWVCYVGTMPTMTGASAQVAGPAAQAIASEYEEICGAVGGYLAELGVPGKCVRRDGDPARALEKLAEEVRADMIVVGRSSGRTHAVIGSVAVALVKKANRPVVVVP